MRAVEVPKPHGGGTRILGVPSVGDRVAQTVVAGVIEAGAELAAARADYRSAGAALTKVDDWETTLARRFAKETARLLVDAHTR